MTRVGVQLHSRRTNDALAKETRAHQTRRDLFVAPFLVTFSENCCPRTCSPETRHRSPRVHILFMKKWPRSTLLIERYGADFPFHSDSFPNQAGYSEGRLFVSERD